MCLQAMWGLVLVASCGCDGEQALTIELAGCSGGEGDGDSSGELAAVMSS